MSEKVFVDEANRFFCPICQRINYGSNYLKTVFQDQRSLWLANMVTHYRHNHISWWNNCWGRYGNDYRGYWFKDYDDEKEKVNETAKRQIARFAKQYMLENDFKVSHFKALQNTSIKTIETVRKILEPELTDFVGKTKTVIIHSRMDRVIDRARYKYLSESKRVQ